MTHPVKIRITVILLDFKQSRNGRNTEKAITKSIVRRLYFQKKILLDLIPSDLQSVNLCFKVIL